MTLKFYKFIDFEAFVAKIGGQFIDLYSGLKLHSAKEGDKIRVYLTPEKVEEHSDFVEECCLEDIFLLHPKIGRLYTPSQIEYRSEHGFHGLWFRMPKDGKEGEIFKGLAYYLPIVKQ